MRKTSIHSHHLFSDFPSALTPAALSLKLREDISLGTKTGSGACVFTSKRIQELNSIHNEEYLVSAMYQELAEIFELDGIKVFGSEESKWLPQDTVVDRNTFLKPDLVISKQWFVQRREPTRAQNQSLTQSRLAAGMAFGMPELGVADCIRGFMECKLQQDLTLAPFGSCTEYLYHLNKLALKNPLAANHPPIRGVVFNRLGFLAVSMCSTSKSSISAFTANWSDPGSQGLLRDHFALRSDWEIGLEVLAEKLNVDIVSFLGQGGHGRVFTVTSSESGHSSFQALKIKISRSGATALAPIANEYLLLKKARDQGFPVVNVFRYDEATEDDNLFVAGYLMELGQPVKMDRLNRTKIAESLLTFHKRHAYHGDARIQNLISVDGELKWIDLMSTVLETPGTSAYVEDVQMLVNSLGGPKPSHEQLKAYELKPSLDRLTTFLKW